MGWWAAEIGLRVRGGRGRADGRAWGLVSRVELRLGGVAAVVLYPRLAIHTLFMGILWGGSKHGMHVCWCVGLAVFKWCLKRGQWAAWHWGRGGGVRYSGATERLYSTAY